MDINFYAGGKGKILGLLMASPEEFQTYAAALVDVPQGCQLVTRIRSVQVGKNPAEKRREILIGAAPIGEALMIEGEKTEAVKPLPPPAVPRALEVPQTVKDATDGDLEVMAARNGVNISPGWRKRNRQLREADVAAAMVKAKEAVALA